MPQLRAQDCRAIRRRVMKARAVVMLAALFVWTVAAFSGAAGWRLAQWWPPAAWLGLFVMVAFIVWQTNVTMRLQALLRRIERERLEMDRLTRRIVLDEKTGRHT